MIQMWGAGRLFPEQFRHNPFQPADVHVQDVVGDLPPHAREREGLELRQQSTRDAVTSNGLDQLTAAQKPPVRRFHRNEAMRQAGEIANGDRLS